MSTIPVWDYLWSLGVPGNLVASAILALFAGIVGFVKVRPVVKTHLRRTAEIHRHLDPNDDWHIGDE